jgi:hypothetical protein
VSDRREQQLAGLPDASCRGAAHSRIARPAGPRRNFPSGSRSRCRPIATVSHALIHTCGKRRYPLQPLGKLTLFLFESSNPTLRSRELLLKMDEVLGSVFAISALRVAFLWNGKRRGDCGEIYLG